MALCGTAAAQPGPQLLQGLAGALDLAAAAGGDDAGRAARVADLAGCLFRAACGLTSTGACIPP